ncbi:MAG: class I SAM-dependent methyltransferase [Candidatus Omnitrophica bacterium]|nr:class I SAM-dependent methyltransferase [Candidatus Omnitrophota bacterium]
MKSGTASWYEKLWWYDLSGASLDYLRWYEKTFLKEDIEWDLKKVLNIGCSRNIFLKELKDKGCDVTAVDINKDIVKFTKNVLGIDKSFVSDVYKLGINEEKSKFDIIIIFQVLEHLEAPGEVFRLLKGFLAYDAKLFLSIPNRDRIYPQKSVWDYPPHHLTRWDKKSIRMFFETHSYRVDKIITAPLLCDDVYYLFNFGFGTRTLERKIRAGSKNIFFPLIYYSLCKLRVAFYKLLAAIGRIFIKEGQDLYVVVNCRKD